MRKSCDAGWKPGIPEFATLALIIIVVSIVSVLMIGLMFDGVIRHWEDVERCQKSAPTPYDYHRCR